jgi:hypothetical protein
MFQFGFIDRMGYPGHFSATDSAPYADQPSVEGFGGEKERSRPYLAGLRKESKVSDF